MTSSISRVAVCMLLGLFGLCSHAYGAVDIKYSAQYDDDVVKDGKDVTGVKGVVALNAETLLFETSQLLATASQDKVAKAIEGNDHRLWPFRSTGETSFDIPGVACPIGIPAQDMRPGISIVSHKPKDTEHKEAIKKLKDHVAAFNKAMIAAPAFPARDLCFDVDMCGDKDLCLKNFESLELAAPPPDDGTLSWAIRSQAPHLIKQRLNSEMSLDEPGQNGLRPIHWAVYYKDPETIRDLLSAGAGSWKRVLIEGVPPYLQADPISLAIQVNCLKCIKILDPSRTRGEVAVGKSPHVATAAYQNRKEIFRYYWHPLKLHPETLTKISSSIYAGNATEIYDVVKEYPSASLSVAELSRRLMIKSIHEAKYDEARSYIGSFDFSSITEKRLIRALQALMATDEYDLAELFIYPHIDYRRLKRIPKQGMRDHLIESGFFSDDELAAAIERNDKASISVLLSNRTPENNFINKSKELYVDALVRNRHTMVGRLDPLDLSDEEIGSTLKRLMTDYTDPEWTIRTWNRAFDLCQSYQSCDLSDYKIWNSIAYRGDTAIWRLAIQRTGRSGPRRLESTLSSPIRRGHADFVSAIIGEQTIPRHWFLDLLSEAVKNRQFAIAEILLEANVRNRPTKMTAQNPLIYWHLINLPSKTGVTGQVHVMADWVELLNKAGILPNEKLQNGKPLILAAFENGNHALVEALRSSGADDQPIVEYENDQDLFVQLQRATEERNARKIRKIAVELGERDLLYSEIYIHFLEQVRAGNLVAAKALLSTNPEFGEIRRNGLLLDSTGHQHPITQSGIDPFILAVLSGEPKLVRYIYNSSNAEPDLYPHKTPLFLALVSHNKETTQFLIEKGFEFSARHIPSLLLAQRDEMAKKVLASLLAGEHISASEQDTLLALIISNREQEFVFHVLEAGLGEGLGQSHERALLTANSIGNPNIVRAVEEMIAK